jgi:putative DNA primase/helicase
VLGISHFSKGTAGRDPIDRVTGSLAFGALARVVLAAAKLPEDQHKGARLLARAKSNIGPDSGGVLYHLEQTEITGHPGIINTKVIWGATVEGSARDLLAKAEQNDGEEKTATDEAREWLADLLEHGPMKASDVKKEARQAGISDKALRRAREKLGIKPQKRAFTGGWEWGLSQDAPAPRCPEHAQTTNEGTLGTFDKTPKMPNSPQEYQDALKNCSGTLGASSEEGHLEDTLVEVEI